MAAKNRKKEPHIARSGKPAEHANPIAPENAKTIRQTTDPPLDFLAAIETIPLTALHDVRRIKGKLEELLEKMEDTFLEDYISVILTDEKELYRPKDVLSEVYPHILEITVDNSRTRNIYAGLQGENMDAEKGMEKLQSPIEAFREFYQLMQQQPLSESEETVIAEILDEMGGEAE